MADDNTNNRNAAKNAAKTAAELKKQKKKKWCPIVAPEAFGGRVLGESLLDDASMLMNRAITVNMMQLMGDIKKQNMNIMFKVIDVKEGKGLTEAVKFEVSSSSIKRLAKREKDKISDSFVVKTSDNKLVRIKPLMITNNLANGSVTADLIKKCRVVCKEIVNKTTFQELIISLVQYKLQREIRDALHKTYPLRTCEIRMLKLETRKKTETVEEEMMLKMKKQQEAKDQEKKEEQEHTQEHTAQDTEETTQDTEEDVESEDSDDNQS